MDQLVAQACDDDGVLCVLSGEAGVGKTRLVRELEMRAAVAGMQCLRGQCLAVEGGEVPFAPLADVFGDLTASQRSAAPEILQNLFGAPGVAAPAEPVAPARAHAAL